jgi:hypothetical protein
MMDEITLLRLYCIADDFIKTIMKYPIGQEIRRDWEGRRGPQRRLSLAEVITLNIMRYYLRVVDLKTFHRLAKTSYRAYFPMLPNYENFLKASNKSVMGITLFLRYLLFVNRKAVSGDYFFMDSTAISVCNNYNIASHRVTKGYSARGMSSKGWFYGFKLHGVCDDDGNIVNLKFSPGNVYDNQEVEDLTNGLSGLFVGDAGYILKKEVFEALYEKHRHILHGVRKNMKRLMTGRQGELFKKRNIIETVWGVLKERFQLVNHLARGMTGLFRHYLYSLVSFLLRPFLAPCRLLIPSAVGC